MSPQPPVVLTIAGSDSSGGAGLQADLRTFAALGVHGCSALTLVSSQNTAEFRAAVPMPPGMVLSQIEAVLDDLPVAATKIGMLFTEANINAVATIAAHGRLPLLVVDPVLVGMHGRSLFDPDTERLVMERLVPEARVLTPNRLEAGLLLGRAVLDEASALTEAAHELAARGPEAVVITGGRSPGASARDVAVVGGVELVLEEPWVDTANVRGSGDTFSAAVTALIAGGAAVLDAVGAAHRFTREALIRSAGWRLGAGQGPLGHFPVRPHGDGEAGSVP